MKKDRFKRKRHYDINIRSFDGWLFFTFDIFEMIQTEGTNDKLFSDCSLWCDIIVSAVRRWHRFRNNWKCQTSKNEKEESRDSAGRQRAALSIPRTCHYSSSKLETRNARHYDRRVNILLHPSCSRLLYNIPWQ